MLKKIIITILLITAVASAAIFVYRYSIIKYSVETIIRKILPDYITVDRINFDFKDSKVSFYGFRISNPAGFSYHYLLEVEEISCGYKMKGRNPLDGLVITGPVLSAPILSIERLNDGRINMEEMKKAVAKNASIPVRNTSEKKDDPAASVAANKRLGDIIKLPGTFAVTRGKVIFIDRFAGRAPQTITFDNIEAKLSIKFDNTYSTILHLESAGEGNINADRSESVKWQIGMTPAAERLTMSNRFNVSGVDLITFRPYYDRYSPLAIYGGRFSGTLIFDFDNGSIGSTNEIYLSGLKFSVKPGCENAQFLEATVPQLVKYFTSSSGDIVFDFKIKGDMSDPKFFLGPISKEALTSMAIDKISEAIRRVTDKEGRENAAGKKSDIEKAKEYIDLFKGMIEKKE